MDDGIAERDVFELGDGLLVDGYVVIKKYTLFRKFRNNFMTDETKQLK